MRSNSVLAVFMSVSLIMIFHVDLREPSHTQTHIHTHTYTSLSVCIRIRHKMEEWRKLNVLERFCLLDQFYTPFQPELIWTRSLLPLAVFSIFLPPQINHTRTHTHIRCHLLGLLLDYHAVIAFFSFITRMRADLPLHWDRLSVYIWESWAQVIALNRPDSMATGFL